MFDISRKGNYFLLVGKVQRNIFVNKPIVNDAHCNKTHKKHII